MLLTAPIGIEIRRLWYRSYLLLHLLTAPIGIEISI